MGKVTESIWSGNQTTVALAEVTHVERRLLYGTGKFEGAWAVTGKSVLSQQMHSYHNAAFIPEEERESFMKAWCRYRAELESDTLAPFIPGKDDRIVVTNEQTNQQNE